MHQLNVVAVVAEKDVDSCRKKNRRWFPDTESNASIECRSCCRRKKTLTLLKKKIVFCFLKPNQTHPLNVVAFVAEKDVDSFE